MITNGPAWLDREKYDLLAEPDGEGQPNGNQWKMMLQKLSVDAIVLGKTGPKLTRSEGDPNGLPSLLFRGLGVLPARNATMAGQEQLGLRLESTKAPVDVLVIDSAEKPSAN